MFLSNLPDKKFVSFRPFPSHMRLAVFKIGLLLGLQHCFSSETSRQPASDSEHKQSEGETPNGRVVRTFASDYLSEDKNREETFEELKRTASRDPTQDSGDPPSLTAAEAALVRVQGASVGIPKDADAAAVAQHIGKLGKGLLGGHEVRFSDREDYRCESTEVKAFN